MDVRLTDEQRQLRVAAAKLARDLGPRNVADLGDELRRARLEKAVDTAGWRTLRRDGASGVEVAIVAEEFACGLVDVAFAGPLLADDLCRRSRQNPPGASTESWTLAVGPVAPDARGCHQSLALHGKSVVAADLRPGEVGADLTRIVAEVETKGTVLGELTDTAVIRWHALALVVTAAELLGAARGAQELACEYAKVREQYGKPIGSYQAVAHLLAEGQALLEGSVSVLRHAAWSIDELPPEDAMAAARVAKLYCAPAARTICENAIQVHGGIGNTWECAAHLYLRRVLTATELFRVSLEEINSGLS